MLYSLGPIAFEIAPFNVHQVDRAGAADFAEKAIVGAEPRVEFVGEGANTWTFNCRLYPRTFGGVGELAELDQMRASGRPQYLMRGDGRPLGWVVVTSVAERSTYLDARGVGGQIEVTISVRRAGRPSAGSFFALIAGLVR